MTLPSEGRGREFESRRVRQFFSIVQRFAESDPSSPATNSNSMGWNSASLMLKLCCILCLSGITHDRGGRKSMGSWRSTSQTKKSSPSKSSINRAGNPKKSPAWGGAEVFNLCCQGDTAARANDNSSASPRRQQQLKAEVVSSNLAGCAISPNRWAVQTGPPGRPTPSIKVCQTLSGSRTGLV
jgi:hypothetical protein